MDERFGRYTRLHFDRPHPRVLRIRMTNGKLNAADRAMHAELAGIWSEIDADDSINAAIITGQGANFSAGGDFAMIDEIIADFDTRARAWKEARDVVHGIIDCSKPIVSAMRGVAVGAGLVCGLLADVSIAAEDAASSTATPGSASPPGDHAAIIWPLLCGLAKAKYHLLTCEPLLRHRGRADWPGVARGARRGSSTPPCGRGRYAGLPRARPPRSAGPSTRSTTGCARRGRPSMPRWRLSSWASPGRRRRRGWRRTARSVRPLFPARADGSPARVRTGASEQDGSGALRVPPPPPALAPQNRTDQGPLHGCLRRARAGASEQGSRPAPGASARARDGASEQDGSGAAPGASAASAPAPQNRADQGPLRVPPPRPRWRLRTGRIRGRSGCLRPASRAGASEQDGSGPAPGASAGRAEPERDR